MNNKPIIFISHITEESYLAIELKKLLNDAFPNYFQIFVSSDDESIKLGTNNIESITNHLKDCNSIILICSPLSIKREWINFEAGAGWVKGIPFISFCHSGTHPSQLPLPFNLKQGILGRNENEVCKLIKHLGEFFNIQPKNIQYDEFVVKIKWYESYINHNNLVINNFLKLRQILSNFRDYVEYSFDDVINDLLNEEAPIFYIPEKLGIHGMILQIMYELQVLDIINYRLIQNNYQSGNLGECTSYQVIKTNKFVDAVKSLSDFLYKQQDQDKIDNNTYRWSI